MLPFSLIRRTLPRWFVMQIIKSFGVPENIKYHDDFLIDLGWSLRTLGCMDVLHMHEPVLISNAATPFCD